MYLIIIAILRFWGVAVSMSNTKRTEIDSFKTYNCFAVKTIERRGF